MKREYIIMAIVLICLAVLIAAVAIFLIPYGYWKGVVTAVAIIFAFEALRYLVMAGGQ